MADKKISALTSATTPLAGTEVLPIVQSGTTVKVAVSDLTAGRAVSASSLTAGGTPPSSGIINIVSAASAVALAISDNATSSVYVRPASGGVVIGTDSGGILRFASNGSAAADTKLTLSAAGDATLASGNLVQGTAAKGINFTANTPAAGMTSQLLNWYEQGTWTPSDQSGAGLTFTGVTARYTRVGRQVTCQAVLTYPATASVSAAKIGGLPFTQTDLGSGVSSYVSSGGQQFFRSQNSSTNIIPQNVTGNDTANVTLSGVTLLFTFVYTV
jgi:hypothetical protein